MTSKIPFETHLLQAIQREREIQSTFFELVNEFENRISTFDFRKESILIEDYFGAGNGQKSILQRLIRENKVPEATCRKYETKEKNIKYDFKGIYFFLLDDRPFYIGISKGVIGRICQHLKGKNHNTSSLAYKLGLLRYEYLNGKEHYGTRKELNFVSEVEPVKDFLKKQRIAWIHIKDDNELYLFEIFCSMKFKTILNSFETH